MLIYGNGNNLRNGIMEMTEKIKITRKEIEDLYDIEEPEDHKEEEVVVTETWEEATERKDKENKWLSE